MMSKNFQQCVAHSLSAWVWHKPHQWLIVYIDTSAAGLDIPNWQWLACQCIICGVFHQVNYRGDFAGTCGCLRLGRRYVWCVHSGDLWGCVWSEVHKWRYIPRWWRHWQHHLTAIGARAKLQAFTASLHTQGFQISVHFHALGIAYI